MKDSCTPRGYHLVVIREPKAVSTLKYTEERQTALGSSDAMRHLYRYEASRQLQYISYN